MHTFDKIADWIANAGLYAAWLAICLMALHITTDITLRYFGGGSLNGTLEITSYYYMVAVVFLPLAIAERNRDHVIVELFTGHLPRRGVAFFDTLAVTLTLVFVLTLLWFAFEMAVKQTQVGEYTHGAALPITTWPTRWFVVFGIAAYAVCLVFNLVQDIRTLVTGREPEHGEAAHHVSAEI